MSKRKRMTGKAEEMRQVSYVLRQHDIPVDMVRMALLAMCGVQVNVETVYDFRVLREQLLGTR